MTLKFLDLSRIRSICPMCVHCVHSKRTLGYSIGLIMNIRREKLAACLMCDMKELVLCSRKGAVVYKVRAKTSRHLEAADRWCSGTQVSHRKGHCLKKTVNGTVLADLKGGTLP